MPPRPDLGVDPHVTSALGRGLGQKADMDNVGVATDGGCGGQGVSQAAEDVKPLDQHLLGITQHEANGEAWLELVCREGDQVANVESKKD
jgi:hypothetical protein